jgi:hypothetical protein
MTSLQKALNRNDNFFEITDNQEAKHILVELGIAEHLTNGARLSEPDVKIARCEDLETHHVIAIYYSGHKEIKDNGFVVQFHRKHSGSEAAILVYLDTWMKADGIKPYTVIRKSTKTGKN